MFGRSSITSMLTTLTASLLLKIISINSTSNSHFLPMRKKILMNLFSKSNSSNYKLNKVTRKNKMKMNLRSQGD